jgi:hypothetical protein
MEQNVGGLDRTARLVIGPLLVIVGLAVLLGTVPGGQAVGAVLLVAGAVLLATGLTRRCVINRLLGVDTRSR